jgi:hypothetical protein
VFRSCRVVLARFLRRRHSSVLVNAFPGEFCGVAGTSRVLARVIGPDASVMDLRRLSRDGIRSYLRYWLEAFRLPVIPPAEILGRMRRLARSRPRSGTWRQAAG